MFRRYTSVLTKLIVLISLSSAGLGQFTPPSSGGGGGGGITISTGQVAVGTGTNTVGGFGGFTRDALTGHVSIDTTVSQTPIGSELVTDGNFTTCPGTWTLDTAARCGSGNVVVLYSNAVVASVANNGGLFELTTATNHYLVTGQSVNISGATGQTSLNNDWVATRISDTVFTLDGSTYAAGYDANSAQTYTGPDLASGVFSTTANTGYLVSFDISGSNAPLYFGFGHNAFSTAEISGDGTHTVFFIANYTGADETIYFDDWNYTTGDTWTLDNISIKATTTLGDVASPLLLTGPDGNSWFNLVLNTAAPFNIYAPSTFGIGSLAGGTTNTGSVVAIGPGVLSSNTSGRFNTGLGYLALNANTEGEANLGIGFQALAANTTGGNNTAIGGVRTLLKNTTGSNNVAVGAYAGQNITTASNNVLVGQAAGGNLTTGDSNILFGSAGGSGITTGTYNVVFGVNAMSDASVTGASNNVAFGRDVLSKTTANNSMGIGYQALSNATSGTNIAIGLFAGKAITTGYGNTIVGTQAGSVAITTKNNNTFFGAEAGYAVTGESNTGIGASALAASGAVDNNTAVGSYALVSTTGSGNVALGFKAGLYETGSDAFYVDNQDRTNTAGDKAGALLYGTFNATATSQTLNTPGKFSANYFAGIPANVPSVGTCGTIGTGSTNAAGFITSGTTGSCVSVMTFASATATTGWSCAISNATTANLIRQTGSSTTTATFTGVTVTNDVLNYNCIAY